MVTGVPVEGAFYGRGPGLDGRDEFDDGGHLPASAANAAPCAVRVSSASLSARACKLARRSWFLIAALSFVAVMLWSSFVS
jgi:hypothetical protein